MKYLDKKTIKLLIVLGVLILVLIIGALLINIFKSKSLSYEKIEDKLIVSAKKYYSDNKDNFPINDNETVEIDSDLLSEQGYMKSLKDYQKDSSVSCNGKVYVTKTGNYYYYSPYLNCGNSYITPYLKEKVLEDLTTEKDGLYSVEQFYNGEIKKTYIYKGEYPENYIEIDKTLWRIVKIDNEGNFEIIQADVGEKYKTVVWDNRYNKDDSANSGINNYDASRIKRVLLNYYNNDSLFSDNFREKMISKKNCIHGRSIYDTENNGSIECSVLSEDYDFLTLLSAYDFINASLDVECKSIEDMFCSNYNYMNKYSYTWWLLTPNSKTSYKGYKVDNIAYRAKLSDLAYARILLTLNKNVVYSGGSGTKSDPYTIK